MIKINITVPLKYTYEKMIEAAEKVLKLQIPDRTDVKILKLTLNTDDKENLHYKMTLGLSFDEQTEQRLCKRRKIISKVESLSFNIEKKTLVNKPIIVGSGPAGLFAALTLAEAGANPIVFERGCDVDRRVEIVNRFFCGDMLDEECNVQFGEGGAGTFSDGKLKPGLHDRYKIKVLEEFVRAGAPESIMYLSNPHLGTDKLRSIVKRIRERIIMLGGSVVFSARVTDVLVKNGRAYGVKYEKDAAMQEVLSDNIILATGHSARDVFAMLKSHNVKIEQKGFGIGVRIEHPQELTDKLIYGRKSGDGLEPASYRLVTHLPNNRSVYSFCMCPGGSVVAAASQVGTVVTNGMSNFGRSGTNSNAAFLVSVHPEDFESEEALAGFALQERLERLAFSVGGDCRAPIQRMEDFLRDKESTHFGDVKPTYPRGTVFARAEEYLPDYITDSLRCAIADFEEWMPGFYLPDALLTGVETRSTSPVRIVRNSKHQTEAVLGLYPCGEGAGYAGGIMSSAVDGIKTAEIMLLNAK